MHGPHLSQDQEIPAAGFWVFDSKSAFPSDKPKLFTKPSSVLTLLDVLLFVLLQTAPPSGLVVFSSSYKLSTDFLQGRAELTKSLSSAAIHAVNVYAMHLKECCSVLQPDVYIHCISSVHVI